MRGEGASADLEHKMSWMTQPLSTIANYTVFMRFHLNCRTWLIKTRPIAFEIAEITQFSFAVLDKRDWEPAKVSQSGNYAFFSQLHSDCGKLKLIVYFLIYCPSSICIWMHFNVSHSKRFVPCLTFATHCCHFNSAAFLSSRKMQWMRLHKWLSGVYRRPGE